MVKIVLPLLLLGSSTLFAQSKKPLDHSVYDNWKSAGERAISNDGNFVVYSIVAQEGDGELVVRNAGTGYTKTIPRGYAAVITEDSRYVVFKIKPPYKDTRQARIKKKKPDDMPKDSLGMLVLGTDSLTKVAKVKSFKTPEKGTGWLAYHLEKPMADTAARKKAAPDSVKLKVDMLARMADSVIRKSLDAVKGKIEKEEVIAAANKAVKEIYKKADDSELSEILADAEGDEVPGTATASEGTELVLKNMYTGATLSFKLVSDFLFDKQGTRLLLKTTKNSKDTNSKAGILVHDLDKGNSQTIMKGLNDAKSFSFDESGNQLAFVAERDSSSKALQKYYKLWYFKAGADSATLLADKNSVGMRIGNTVSENAATRFSKNGGKLFFSVAPIQPARDTNLVDFELARLDIWHYKDDYLQPQQLKQLPQEMRRGYMAVTIPGKNEIVQLGDDSAENITLVNEGDADWVLGQSTKGNRYTSQWEGRTKATAYVIATNTAKRTLVNNKSYGNYQPSPNGRFVYWYDLAGKHYFTYNVANGLTTNITQQIKVPLYDTENDEPDFPSAAGTIGWVSNDRYFLVKDEFDIWQVDPTGKEQPLNLTNNFGRKNKVTFNYVRLDPEKRFFDKGETILVTAQDKTSKEGGYFSVKTNEVANPLKLDMGAYATGQVVKAANANKYLLQRSTPAASELYYGDDMTKLAQLTNIAAQQKDYNWLTSELVKWKMLDGKMSEGLLFKPANFDPAKKYPVIFYFYERNADGLYNYRAPAPSASTINIAYFVSNGYLVFDPNIYYKQGEPGQSAYNSVVSAARHLAKMPFVDSTNMAIQGQSWGGYQVAYLVTKTNMFKAAGAGAPVSNMTSAYGGIRWGAGVSRQFQYEKTQSRLGATLWERPDLYIKNSPLFAADKINTPILLMHNDADGAVPWYQGIEFFTALKRLNKKVWLLQYNGEDHNLVERKNRKDLSVRLSQFFDYYLKGAKPAAWIKDGLPATQKGRDWGLNTD
jgi:dipeptidyl aminopeptidase/acylaminoacyl peptidase